MGFDQIWRQMAQLSGFRYEGTLLDNLRDAVTKWSKNVTRSNDILKDEHVVGPGCSKSGMEEQFAARQTCRLILKDTPD